MSQVLKLRDRVLRIFFNRIQNFCLGGGTALSLCYFQHRLSFDLDFFCKELVVKEVDEVLDFLRAVRGLTIRLKSEMASKNKAKVLTYEIGEEGKEVVLKIDFIEDVYRRIKKNQAFNGIPALALEDIYLRKIYALAGVIKRESSTGKGYFLGGRQEVKDFFDLYFLSTTFKPLSKFSDAYCNLIEKESLVTWYRTFNRQSAKLGLGDIRTDKIVSFRDMEKHFKSEIDALIRSETGS